MKFYKEIDLDIQADRMRIMRGWKPEEKPREYMLKTLDLIEQGKLQEAYDYMDEWGDEYCPERECPFIEYMNPDILRLVKDYVAGEVLQRERILFSIPE